MLALRKHAGKNRECLGVHGLRGWTGRTDSAIKTNRLSNDRRGRRRVPGYHHGAHAKCVQFGNERRRVGTRWIAQCDEAG